MIPLIGNDVKQYRMAKQMTQEDLAHAIGVTRQTIGLIEKNQYNPTILLCLKLSQVLDQSLDTLFYMKEDGAYDAR